MAPSTLKTVLITAALAVAAVQAQSDEVIWHNRYHGILAMAAYGDYATKCPNQTFTESNKLKNFLNSTLEPFTILDEWGPTEHGSQGFSALIPEMAKVTLVFKGNYALEQALPHDVASLDVLGLEDVCHGCTANALALAGYQEAVAATNNFEKARASWKENDMWFSITGHGLGGMHAIIASLDLGTQNISKFTHSYNAPRTLNPAAAGYYDWMYGGDMTERASTNAAKTPFLIPASNDYAFTNTAFYYYGYNATYKMQQKACYEAPEDPSCMPSGELNDVDSFFVFANVGECGGADKQNVQVALDFIAANSGNSSAATNSTASTTSLASNATVTNNVLGSIVNNATSSLSMTSAESTSLAVPAGLQTDGQAGMAATSVASGSASPTNAKGLVAANAAAEGSTVAAQATTGAASQLTISFSTLAVIIAFSQSFLRLQSRFQR